MNQAESRDLTPAPAASLSPPLFPVLGSLWLGAVLLMLLLVGMACGTFFESEHDLPYAQAVFYGSWWFEGLLLLFTVNVVCSILARLPLTRKRIGFFLTHAGLLTIVVGAMLTKFLATDGVLSITEGQTASTFQLRDGDALTLYNQRDDTQKTVELSGNGIGGFQAINQPHAPALVADTLRVEVERYLPDSTSSREVVDDNTRPSPAVEVSLGPAGHAASTWLFAERPKRLGQVNALYRYVTTPAELARLLKETSAAAPQSAGTMRWTLNGVTRSLPVESAMKKPAPLGDTGYTLKVLRYLPHAQVDADNKLVNASPRPANPAVVVEVTGPHGSERRNCFAKYPDFGAMHGESKAPELKLVFVSTAASTPAAPLEILGGAGGDLYVRWTAADQSITTQPLTLGQQIETPWPGRTLTVLRRFERARFRNRIDPVSPIRKNRIPALEVHLTTAKHANTMWLQRGYPGRVSIDGQPFELLYGDEQRPLGFSVTLDDFALGFYPGGGMPRSYESDITIRDPATRQDLSRKITMNNPVKFGGYALFQSSYLMGTGPATSILSVARDPGLPVVFAGYAATFLGMVWVLVTRIGERRKLARLRAALESP